MNKDIIILKKLIQYRISNLKKYAKMERANQRYIDSENLFIKDLTSVYNNLSNITNLDTWAKIEEQMINIEKNDKEISGHTLQIRTQSKGNNFTLITINLSLEC